MTNSNETDHQQSGGKFVAAIRSRLRKQEKPRGRGKKKTKLYFNNRLSKKSIIFLSLALFQGKNIKDNSGARYHLAMLYSYEKLLSSDFRVRRGRGESGRGCPGFRVCVCVCVCCVVLCCVVLCCVVLCCVVLCVH